MFDLLKDGGRLRVNEEMKQDGSTKDMIFPVPSLISAVSQ